MKKEKAFSDDHALEIIQEYKQVSGDRGNFESHWQEIAQRIYPSHSFLFQSKNSSSTEGEKRTQELFDSTGAIALNRFGAILDSLLTPRNQKWHRIQPSDPTLKRNREVMLWFEAANDLLFKYRYAPQANFASQNQLDYKSLGAYGTSSMFIDKLITEPGIRYKNTHLSEMYFAENHQGIVDRATRCFNLTARQAMKKWGKTLPEQILSSVEKNPNQKFEFLHCVKPREDRDQERADYKGMLYGSYYVSLTGNLPLSEGGYRTFPYAISRYEQAPNEVYGRSPAMDVLPAIKTLNEQKKALLKQGHRAVDPVLLVHDDGIIDGFSYKPGAMNAGGVTAEGRALVQALPVGQIQAGKEMMDDERAVINDAFLITLFQILTETPEMTAREVVERASEKGILLAPTVGRQQSEKLGPTVDREIDVLADQGLLPPMPRMLIEAKGEYHLEYDSPLSRLQKAEETSGLMRTIEMAINVATQTQNPEPLDFFNWDVIVPDVADQQAVPMKWINTMDKVNAIRQGRSQQSQINTAIQAAPGAAAMVNASSKAGKVA